MISLILPNHNKAAYLTETIQCLIAQSFENWEAIFIDDGSTDQSVSIIQSFAAIDKRIKLITLTKQQNGGSVCRNKGFKEAQGNYVLFMDSDDVLSSTCLAKRFEILEHYSTLDFAVFGMRTFFEKVGDSQSTWIPQKEKALVKFYAHNLPWQTMQPLYRKSFLEQSNIKFDEQFPRLQDVDFHTQVLLKSPKFEVFPSKIDCFYRISANRKVVKPNQFYENYVLAMNRYYFKYVNKDSTKNLNFTLLQGISLLINAKQKKELSAKTTFAQKRILLQNIKGAAYILLNLYALIGVYVPKHIPGLRFLFKIALKGLVK